MNRKTFLLILLSFVLMAFVIKLFLSDDGDRNPMRFSNYSDSGYYEIDPETILDSLNRGDNNVFAAASEEIMSRNEPDYEAIHWSQSDYLKIANVVSQEVWHESLDLKEWKILDLYLNQSCQNDPRGFYEFSMVYFQNSGVEFWKRQYHARLIDIFSWQGVIRWGEADFSDAILPGWGNATLDDFKVTADDALFIAESNGGSKMRQEAHKPCRIFVQLNNYSPVNGYTNNDWIVDYGTAGSYIRINPFSGKFRAIDTK